MSQPRGANGRFIKAGGAYVEISADDSKAIRALRNVQNRLKAFAAQTQAVGRNMVTTGAMAGASLVPVVTILSNFKSELSAVAAVSGASAEQMAKLEVRARELGATTSFTASQVAEAMKYLGMAGFSTDQIEASIQDVLNLARAGNIELGQAADIASDVGQAFGLSADEIKRVSDVMATAASKSNTTIFTLGETFKYAAPLAAAAGQSIETTAAATGLLGNNGIKATMAGTDLALIFKKLAESGMQKTFKDLGVETVTADGRIRDLVEIMSDLNEAISHMTAAERLNWMATNFDRAAKSAQILSSQSAQLKKLAAATNEAAGAGQRMADIMADNIGGKLMEMFSALESSVIDLGEALVPVLEPNVEKLTEFLGEMGKWITTNHALIQDLIKVGAYTTAWGVAIYAVGTAAGIASSLIGLLIKAVAVSKLAFAAATVSVASFGAALGALYFVGAAVALYKWNKALNDLNDALEKSLSLQDKLKSRQQRKNEKVFVESLKITDHSQRKRFLEQQLQQAEKEASGLSASVKGAQKQVDRHNTTFKNAIGDKLLLVAKEELKEQQQSLDVAREHVERLRDAIKELNDESQNGDQLPKVVHDDMPDFSGTEAAASIDSFEKEIADLLQTPMEKFEEFADKLYGLFDEGKITGEQYDQLYAQKKQEAVEDSKTDAQRDAESEAASMFEESRTAMERFEERMLKVNEFLAAGLIDSDTANRVRESELKNLDREMGMEDRKSSARDLTNKALDVRSGEGLNAVMAAVRPQSSQEQKNGQHLANINTQMVQNNQVLGNVFRVLRDAKIIPETKFTGGAASA